MTCVHLVEADRAVRQMEDALREDAALRQTIDARRRLTPGFTTPTPFAPAPSAADRVERHAVVVLVGIRLDDDHALEAEPRLQRAVHRAAGKWPGQRRAARRARHRRVVEVHVRVARARRRGEPGATCAHFFLLALGFAAGRAALRFATRGLAGTARVAADLGRDERAALVELDERVGVVLVLGQHLGRLRLAVVLRLVAEPVRVRSCRTRRAGCPRRRTRSRT